MTRCRDGRRTPTPEHTCREDPITRSLTPGPKAASWCWGVRPHWGTEGPHGSHGPVHPAPLGGQCLSPQPHNTGPAGGWPGTHSPSPRSWASPSRPPPRPPSVPWLLWLVLGLQGGASPRTASVPQGSSTDTPQGSAGPASASMPRKRGLLPLSAEPRDGCSGSCRPPPPLRGEPGEPLSPGSRSRSSVSLT